MKKIIYCIGAIIIVCLLLLVACGREFDEAYIRYDIIATVTDKDIKNYKSDSKYLIYTEGKHGNVEVFEITDNLLAFRFDSSDVYAGIKVGKTYKFTVGGKRNEFFSWYPNIYDYKEIVDENNSAE